MSKEDPTKYIQIAKECTLCDYIKWQTFKLRDFAIEKEQMNKANDDDSSSSNPKKKTFSREEFAELIKSGAFDNK